MQRVGEPTRVDDEVHGTNTSNVEANPLACGTCEYVGKTRQGLGVHCKRMGHERPIIPTQEAPTKPKRSNRIWKREEICILARKDAELLLLHPQYAVTTNRGNQYTTVHQGRDWYVNLLRDAVYSSVDGGEGLNGRTAEAIRLRRQDAEYREIRAMYSSELQNSVRADHSSPGLGATCLVQGASAQESLGAACRLGPEKPLLAQDASAIPDGDDRVSSSNVGTRVQRVGEKSKSARTREAEDIGDSLDLGIPLLETIPQTRVDDEVHGTNQVAALSLENRHDDEVDGSGQSARTRDVRDTGKSLDLGIRSPPSPDVQHVHEVSQRGRISISTCVSDETHSTETESMVEGMRSNSQGDRASSSNVGTRVQRVGEKSKSARTREAEDIGDSLDLGIPLLETIPQTRVDDEVHSTNQPALVEWVENLKHIICEKGAPQGLELLVPGQYCSVNQQVTDNVFAELERIIPAHPRGSKTSSATPNMRKPRRRKKPKRKKAGSRAKLSRRKQRQIWYRRLQQAWRRNQGKAIKTVLDGTWCKEPSKVPMADHLSYWKPLFETESVSDNRNPQPVREPVMELLKPITDAELEVALRSADRNKANGPDGRSLDAIRKAPSGEILRQFNLWLLSACLPTPLSECITTLIPKEVGSTDSSKFRPITVSSWLVRIYHKILATRLSNKCPVSERQKAFLPGDGLSENVHILKHLIRSRTAKSPKPLCLAFLDVKKAFDSVSHESLVNACRRAGVPSALTEYIRGVYSVGATRLVSNGELSPLIRCMQGVKQGDPLSCFLFNLVIDWCLSGLDPNLGIDLGGQILNHLAFADDMAIVTETEQALNMQVQLVTSGLALCGLRVNAAKCSTIRIDVVSSDGGKTRTSRVNPEPFLKIDGQYVSAMAMDDLYKYLGVFFSPRGTFNTVSEKLGKAMKELTTAPLTGFQRLAAVKATVIPQLYHQLVLSDCSIGLLNELDRRIRKAVRKWLHLAADTTNAYMYAPLSEGGMGIVCLTDTIPYLKIRRLRSLLQSTDGIVQHVCNTEPFKSECGKWRRVLDGQTDAITDIDLAGLKQNSLWKWADQLHASLDGKGLRNTARSTMLCGSYPRHVGSDWLARPGNFCGEARMFNQMVALRGSTLETGARRSRGSQAANTFCEACIRPNREGGLEGRAQPDSLSHRLQSCIKTNGYLTTRHDKIVSLLANILRKRGVEVEIEPKIRVTEPGTGNHTFRKPDLVIRKPTALSDQFWVVDVAIVSDGGCVEDPDKPHMDKVNKYSVFREIADYTAGVENATGLVRFSALVFNWRGIPAPKSCADMSALGVSKRNLEFLSRVVVEQGVHMYRLSRRNNAALATELRERLLNAGT